jgi:ParB/RepB/Spo0J family partition protein
MSESRRIPDGSGFGHTGGSNLADYLSAAERSDQIELEMNPGERLVEIPVDLIDRSPFQARTDFDPDELAALGVDVRTNGLNNPVTVRETSGGRYELIAGERRWLAARQARLPHVIARVRALSDFDAHLVGISENNQRANLSPWEQSLEAHRLLEHARSASRPHTQRDLAHYLNRNVSVVNQQLAIAAATTPDLLERTQVSEANVCRLPHVTLHRISKLPETQRPRALKEAIRMLQDRGATASGEVGGPASAAPPREPAESDDWTRLWETGGFQVRVRQPLRDLDPDQAEIYARQIAPALGGLAARVSEGRNAAAVIQWETPQGRLLFVRAPERMSEAERTSARQTLNDLFQSLTARTEPAPTHPSAERPAAESR